MAKYKKVQKQEGFSVKEIKALLQGIDILHGGTEWCPDVQQWKRIRDKINQLKDEDPIQYPQRREPATNSHAFSGPSQMETVTMAPMSQQNISPSTMAMMEQQENERIAIMLRNAQLASANGQLPSAAAMEGRGGPTLAPVHITGSDFV